MGYIPIGGTSEPVVESFINLTDTPESYVGHSLKVPRVKVDESGLEFFALESVPGEYEKVDTYAELPDVAEKAGDIYIVLQSTGVYLINRHEKGMYYSDGITWTRLGNIIAYFNSSNFELYDNTDNTKQLGFDLTGIATATKRSLTIPNKSGTIALTDDLHSQNTDQYLDLGGDAEVSALQAKGAYNHSLAAHAPTDAVSLATVKADEDISDSLSKKHAHSNQSDLDNVSGTNTGDQNLSGYATLDQAIPQTFVNGVPLLEPQRSIEQMHELVDKHYVDSAVASLGARFYMTNVDSGIEDYKDTDLTNPIAVFSNTYASLTTDQYIAGWIEEEEIGQKLISGIFTWKVFAERTSGTRELRIYWKLFERTAAGVEIEIATSAVSDSITGKRLLNVPLNLAVDYVPSETSRIIGKVYAVVGTSGVSPDLTLYGGGVNAGYWEIPANLEIIKDIFIPFAGANKDVDLGSQNLETTGTLTGQNLSGTNTGDQTLPTRDSLGLDTDDTVTFANLSGTNTGDQDLSVLATKKHLEQTIQTLTDAESISWNMNSGGIAVVTLGGARTLANPTNVVAGGLYRLIAKQDGVGSRTLAFGTNFKFPGAVVPVLTSTASAVDIFEFIAETDSILRCVNFIADSK